ncbi:MAG: hypothetical protein ACR2F6_18130 [Mycobacteriales bacterium]
MTRPAHRFAAGLIFSLLAAVPGALGLPHLAAAAPAKCVALIIDTGAGKPTSDCVPYAPGLTGSALLKKAGVQVAVAPDGLACQLDGYPKACTKGDSKHYWSYYLRKPGATKWDYALKGPDTQKATAGETQAWVYVNGKDRQPPATPYAAIAKAGAAASTSPSTAATGAGGASGSSPAASASTGPSAATGSESSGGTSGWWWILLPIGLVVIAAAAVLARRRHAA